MEIEYEATFLNVDKDEIRKRLKDIGAVLIKPKFLQKRIPFNLPKEIHTKDKFVRVRDEKDKITLSYKEFTGKKIEDQKEICLTVDNFENAVKFLELIGCESKSYQESKREIWKLNNVEIMIDEWPFLEPFVEIEGKTEKEVKEISEKLNFDYTKAFFGHVGEIYEMKYKMPVEKVSHLPKIVFEMQNPFLD